MIRLAKLFLYNIHQFYITFNQLKSWTSTYIVLKFLDNIGQWLHTFCSVLSRFTRPASAQFAHPWLKSSSAPPPKSHSFLLANNLSTCGAVLLYNLKTIKWEKMTMPLALLPPPTRVTSVTPSSRHRRIYIYCDAYTISEYRYCVKSLSPAPSCNCNMLRAWN